MPCSGCGGRSFVRRTPTMAVQQSRQGHAPTQMAVPQRHPQSSSPQPQPLRIVQSTTLAQRRTAALRRTI